jgi:hypothetical protein
MQIVIDIPKEMMSYINENEFNAISEAAYGSMAMLAIQNGTPLPKGHGRLIDADDIDNHIIGHVDTRSCPTIIEADTESEDKE